jgi:hypothetical protein
MKQALQCLNELVNEGVIGKYAIGGAVGASFYIEAVNTEHVDAFVFMPPGPGGLISLGPIYDAMIAKGGVARGEHIVIGGWPIQILPAYKPLVEEALADAVQTTFDDVPTSVLLPEHLCAIALDTGRLKDYLRVSMFIEQDEVDPAGLWALVCKYGLQDRLSHVGNWPGVPDAHQG